MSSNEYRNYAELKKIDDFELYIENKLITEVVIDDSFIDSVKLHDNGVGIRTIKKGLLGTSSHTFNNKVGIYKGIDDSIINGEFSFQTMKNFSLNKEYYAKEGIIEDNIHEQINLLRCIFNSNNIIVHLKHEQIQVELITFSSHILNYAGWYELSIYDKLLNENNSFYFKKLENIQEIFSIYPCINRKNFLYVQTISYELIEIESKVNSSLLKLLGDMFLYKENSFSEIELGKKAFSEKLSIYDNGIIQRLDNFNKFDIEGTVKKSNQLINKGVITNQLYSLYDSQKNNKEATGNAIRLNYNFLPKIDHNCLYQIEGDKEKYLRLINGCKILRIKEIKDNTFLNNPNTGEFEGIAICDLLCSGKVKYEFFELYVSGNVYDLYNNIIEVGYYDLNGSHTNKQVIAPNMIIESLNVEFVSYIGS